MPVVTIRGQLGSGAPEIGKQIAYKLSYDYVDREIIAEVAELLNWSKQDVAAKEVPPTTLRDRIARVLGRFPVSINAQMMYLPTWEVPLVDEHYLAGLESIIKELARSQSIVIRGRGSNFILKDFPGALHILVVASMELKVKRVMDELKLDEEAAKKEIQHFDESHREFIKRYFKSEPEDPRYYDLVINSERLSIEKAASIVAGALPVRSGDSGKKSEK